MQNWENIQPNANYNQQNVWYNNTFVATVKQESSTSESPIVGSSSNNGTPQLAQYLMQHPQQNQGQPQLRMNTMTPSPSINDRNLPHFFDANAMQQQYFQQQHYQQQFQQAQQAAAQNIHYLPPGFKPLTPPGLPNAVLPPPSFYGNLRPGQQQQTQSPSPQTTMIPANIAEHVVKLQAALTPRNTPPMDVTSPKSPTSADQTKQCNDAEAATTKTGGGDKEKVLTSEEQKKLAEKKKAEKDAVFHPVYNSHGKLKSHTCKSCNIVFITKAAFWTHNRTHLKPEKTLLCTRCPFVTDLKHHLEYHNRKHDNLKPFKCSRCTYECVNKSMLNSHRKSHSKIFPFHCLDCDYATKYCHSFKLHLRKLEHKPDVVLDEFGIPNPSIVVDVYGTRRGPKKKSATPKRKAIGKLKGKSKGNGKAKAKSKAKGGSASNSSAESDTSSNSDSDSVSSDSAAATTNTATTVNATAAIMPPQQQQQQASPEPMDISPIDNSNAPQLPGLSVNMALQQQVQQLQQQQQQQQQQQNVPDSAVAAAAASLMPSLAMILQHNPNIAFLPYWSINMHMLAAQQHAILSQLPPAVRAAVLQQIEQCRKLIEFQNAENAAADDDAAEDESDDDEEDAMDLSRATPSKEEDQQQQQQQQQNAAINLKLNETPILTRKSRRKGRVLKLYTSVQAKRASTPPEPQTSNSDESDTDPSKKKYFECKFCEIFFKNAVLYSLHMGYHSCDDVFKCNMCGQKCYGPVPFFVHITQQLHE